jgi:uncharacterized membrane protein YdjX (TVP38/TMEM64 family)
MTDEITKCVANPGARVERMSALRGIAASTGFAILVAGLIGARFIPASLIAHIENDLGRIRDLGVVGMALFSVIQVAIALSGFVPGSLIGVLAGTIYGVGGGFPLAALSTMTAALLAFQFARSVFRPLAARFLADRAGRLQNFDAVLAREGWRIVCLLRMSPVMPFAATSYALGASSVSLRDYLIGTLASLPALFGYVIIGALANAGLAVESGGAGVVRWLLIWGGLAATMFLTWRIGRLAAAAGLISQAPARRDGRHLVDPQDFPVLVKEAQALDSR